MKTTKTLVCPGCHKHCQEGKTRCKYGCRYFAKLHAQESDPCKNCKHKWEAFVTQGSTAWKLLSFSRRAKKALRNKTMTETGLLAALNDTEKQLLSALLDKLDHALKQE